MTASVIWDAEERIYKAWYMAGFHAPGEKPVQCLALSPDGMRWIPIPEPAIRSSGPHPRMPRRMKGSRRPHRLRWRSLRKEIIGLRNC